MSLDPDHALFVAVIDAGSLSGAARALGISTAMVSKRLARLEARLGVRLIQRTTRRLAATETGARFHADMTRVIAAAREAEARVRGTRAGPSGPLRISAPTSFGRLHIAPLVGGFLVRHPGIALSLDLSDAYADLIAGRIDVAIRIAGDMPPSLSSRALAPNRRILCASPTYLAEHGTPDDLAALAEHRLLAAQGQLPWRLVRGPLRRTVEGRSRVATNSSEVVRELALAGMGIALRSLWDVGDALADGRLVRVLPEWEGPGDLAIHAVWPRAPRTPPAVAALVAYVADAFDPPPWA